MKIKTLILLSIVLSLISCKSQQQSFDDFKGKIITIGKGGGFTGAYDEFSILENGQVFHYNTIKNERLNIGKLEANMTKQIFNNYEILRLGNEDVNHPGNMNYFVQFNDGDNISKSLWSETENEEANLILFYRFVMNYIKKLKK